MKTELKLAACGMVVVLLCGLVNGDPPTRAVCHRQQAVVVAPNATQYAQQLLVPAPAYQYQVGQQLREEALAERVAELVLAKLEEAAKAGATAPPDEAPPGATDAQRLVDQRCTTCHHHNGTDPEGIDLRDLEGLSELQAWNVFRLTYQGKMPKNGAPLTDQELETLLRWCVDR